MSPEQREVWYTGHVQGVGFRYTTLAIARRFAVTGFVRNLADGRVHMLAEGASDELDGFLLEISSRMGHFVRDVQEERRPATGQYRSFDIR
jgi:acylphosphatase